MTEKLSALEFVATGMRTVIRAGYICTASKLVAFVLAKNNSTDMKRALRMTLTNMRFISFPVTVAVFSFVVVTSTVFSQPTGQGDSIAIASRFDYFQRAILTRDTMSMGDFYTDDAVSLLQNQQVRRGRNAIVQRWKSALANPFILRITSAGINVSSSGQDAFQFGTFEIHAADTTELFLASGKVMFLWKKQVDRWRIALEMDNFDRSSSPTKK
ncbi:MAG: nuclear transport factor 2 family protein [Ignavibacteriae bacterium]|nr:nuclear transport factor 2 family protein [Ignavibacteriota bacterium]